jgi:hypothetical protein
MPACRSRLIFGAGRDGLQPPVAENARPRAIRHTLSTGRVVAPLAGLAMSANQEKTFMIRTILAASAIAAAVFAGPVLAQATAPMAPASSPIKAAVPAAKKVGSEMADTGRKAGHVVAEDGRKVGHAVAEGGRKVASGAKKATAKTKAAVKSASSPS